MKDSIKEWRSDNLIVLKVILKDYKKIYWIIFKHYKLIILILYLLSIIIQLLTMEYFAKDLDNSSGILLINYISLEMSTILMVKIILIIFISIILIISMSLILIFFPFIISSLLIVSLMISVIENNTALFTDELSLTIALAIYILLNVFYYTKKENTKNIKRYFIYIIIIFSIWTSVISSELFKIEKSEMIINMTNWEEIEWTLIFYSWTYYFIEYTNYWDEESTKKVINEKSVESIQYK